MKNIIAIYPGSFDPLTKGHMDIIKKSSKLFDKVIVIVANNANKRHMFTIDARFKFVKDSIKKLKNVNVVELPKDMTVSELSIELNANVIVRGIRNTIDLEYEFSIEEFTKVTNKKIETIYFSPNKKHMFTSSSLVRNLINTGYINKIKSYIPKSVYKTYNKMIKDIES